MTRKLLTALMLCGVLAFGAACGSVATPEFQAEVAEAATEDAPAEETETEATETTEEAATDEPTAVPPTATLAPTDEPTAVPPTATLAPTDEPTAVPTDEPEPTEVVEEAEEVVEADEEMAAAEGDALTVEAAIAAGDIANGQTIFNASYQTSSGGWMCASCHSVDAGMARLVGPPLYGLHERGEERLSESGDTTVAEYVYNSIVAPASYHVVAEPAYVENLMPQNYDEILTEQELTDVVAYILTLGNE